MLDYDEQLCLMLYQAIYENDFAASERDLEAMTNLLYVIGIEIFPELNIPTKLQCSIMADNLLRKRRWIIKFYEDCPYNWLNEYLIADCKRALNIDHRNKDHIDNILKDCAEVKDSLETRYMRGLDEVLIAYAKKYDEDEYKVKTYDGLVEMVDENKNKSKIN